MNEPLFLSDGQVVGLHSEQIELFGGTPGLADPNLLASAVMRPQNAYYYGGTLTLFDLAAEYAFSLGKNHAFHDGNKRVAAAAAITFLGVNGWLVEKEFTNEMLDLVTDKISKAEFAFVLARISKRKGTKIIYFISALERLFRGE